MVCFFVLLLALVAVYGVVEAVGAYVVEYGDRRCVEVLGGYVGPRVHVVNLVTLVGCGGSSNTVTKVTL